LSLAKQLYNEDNEDDGRRGWMVATTLDSAAVMQEKYPDACAHVEQLHAMGVHVLYEFDATQLKSYHALRLHLRQGRSLVNRIIFNFPHVGQGITDQHRNILANQRLLQAFFQCASSFLSHEQQSLMMTKHASKVKACGYALDYVPMPSSASSALPDGEIWVTLKSGQPYDDWHIKKLAKSAGLACRTSFVFDPDAFPGYAHRRTLGYAEGKSAPSNEELKDKTCRTYIFVSKETALVSQGKRKRHDSDDDE
jgi:25S rRNA (uracil2634-N3)-methyltransferase